MVVARIKPTELDLLEDLLSVLPVERIECVLADREFIGQPWFEFLIRQQIGLCIRLRDNSGTDLGSVKACFKTLESGCKVLVYGVNLNVVSTLSDDAERVVIASSLPVIEILRVYKLWFRIECMFRFLKSKGFRNESFHLEEYRNRNPKPFWKREGRPLADSPFAMKNLGRDLLAEACERSGLFIGVWGNHSKRFLRCIRL